MSQFSKDDLTEKATKRVLTLLAEEEFVDIPEIISTTADIVFDTIFPKLSELEDAETWNTSCLNCSSMLEENFRLSMAVEKADVALFELHKGMEEIYALSLMAENNDLDEDDEIGTLVRTVIMRSMKRSSSPDVREIHWKTRVK